MLNTVGSVDRCTGECQVASKTEQCDMSMGLGAESTPPGLAGSSPPRGHLLPSLLMQPRLVPPSSKNTRAISPPSRRRRLGMFPQSLGQPQPGTAPLCRRDSLYHKVPMTVPEMMRPPTCTQLSYSVGANSPSGAQCHLQRQTYVISNLPDA